MMKKIFLCIALYIFALPAVLTCDTYNATSKVKTYKVTVTEGKTKSVKLPSKQKYYASNESNSKVSSYTKKNAKSITIAGISKGTSYVYVTTTKNKKYRYKVTVKAAPKEATTEKTTEDTTEDTTEQPVEVSGACPHCKKSGGLEAVSVEYQREAVWTGYLKEPLISWRERRSVRFLKTVTEKEIQQLVESWHGLIIAKRSYPGNGMNALYNDKISYDILFPCEYSHGNKISPYEQSLAILKGVEPFDLCIFNSDTTDNRDFYLSEWFIKEVVAEPSKKVSVPTGLVKCSKCGYIFEK